MSGLPMWGEPAPPTAPQNLDRAGPAGRREAYP
jgi:hypothetical protein